MRAPIVVPIITHGRGAHVDDLLAVGLVAYMNRPYDWVELHRRNPTEEEINDPNIWVVDVGGQYNPDLKNFDHHQNDPMVEGETAFTLLVRHFGLEEVFASEPWYEVLKVRDNYGPQKAAEHLGLPEIPKGLYSPVEKGVLLAFASEDPEAQKAAVKVAEFFVAEKIRLHEEKKKNIALLEQGEWVEVDGIVVHYAPEATSLGAEEWYEHIGRRPHVSVTTNMEDRLAVFRDKTAEGLVHFEPNEIFWAHKSGFLATTAQKLSKAEVLAYIRASKKK